MGTQYKKFSAIQEDVLYQTLVYLSHFPIVDVDSGLEMKEIAKAALNEVWESDEQKEVPEVTASGVLQSAGSHILERGETYDSEGGERSMSATVQAFNAITGNGLKESEGWLFMVLLKAARAHQKHAYHADSYEDMAAYVALAAESKATESKAS